MRMAVKQRTGVTEATLLIRCFDHARMDSPEMENHIKQSSIAATQIGIASVVHGLCETMTGTL